MSDDDLSAQRERGERAESIASAWGSPPTEGVKPTPELARDAREFVAGLIDADELVRRALAPRTKP